MKDEVRVDLTPIVGGIASVLVEPFWEFIHKLQAEGKVSEAEVDQLEAAIRDRASRLFELVQTQLREQKPEGWKIP
ncbi:MAG: hypothetical protein M3468_03905 [Acidobacteriota bacterium]|nr:hypothetical protein [Acidobacteriota bacterium]